MSDIKTVKLSELSTLSSFNGDEQLIVGRGNILFKTLMTNLISGTLALELSKKADKIRMLAELENKADVTLVNTLLKDKISVATFNQALLEKADHLVVEVKLAERVNIFEFSNTIATIYSKINEKLNESDAISLLIGKANVRHKHSVADVNSLEQILDNKVDLSVYNTGVALKADKIYTDQLISLKSSIGHIHTITDIVGLQDALSGMNGNLNHTHSISDITGLIEIISTKANTVDMNAALSSVSQHIDSEILYVVDLINGLPSGGSGNLNLPTDDGMFIQKSSNLTIATPGIEYVSPSVRTSFTAVQRMSVSNLVSPSDGVLHWNLSEHQILRVYVDSNINTFIITGIEEINANIDYKIVFIKAYNYDYPWMINWPESVVFKGGNSVSLTASADDIDVFNFMVETLDNVNYKLFSLKDSFLW